MPKPSSIDPEKQLMIKAKTLQRLVKEVSYYHQEVEENTSKLNQMKADERDKYDIKKFAEVLDESHMMIPDSANRKNAAVQDLLLFVEGNQDILKQDSEWMETSKALLEEHSS
jgi:tubulin-specific chaperone A